MSNNNVAIVTGGSSGLGNAVVNLLMGNGYQVSSLDLKASKADLSIICDVSHAIEVEQAVTKTISTFGKINALVCCAGISLNKFQPTHLTEIDEWDRCINVNLRGSFLASKYTLPHLIDSKGAVVFIGSVSGVFPQPGSASYSSSKAGVIALSRSIALEYGPLFVRSNCISPGYMKTEMTLGLRTNSKLNEKITEQIPLGRMSDTSEIASAVLFLLTDGASFITGVNITADGGNSLTSFADLNDVRKMWRSKTQSSKNTQ